MDMGANNFTQVGFRGRDDTVSESTNDSWFAALNTNWIASELDTNFRARFIIGRTVNANDNTKAWTLFHSHNGGSFIKTTTTSSVIKTVASNVPGFDDDDDCTQLIGSDTFITPNLGVNEADESTGSFTWTGNAGSTTETETEWTLQIVSSDLEIGDIIELRIRNSDESVLNGGYTFFPIISIQRPRISVRGGILGIRGGTVQSK